MSKEEMKKKISEMIQKARNDYSEMTIYDYIADVLIAAGIGDIKEVEYQVKVLKRALRMAVSKIEYLQFQISTRQECPISIPDIKDEDCEPYIRRAGDELLFEEERKDG